MLIKYFCKLADHSYVPPSKVHNITDEEKGDCKDCINNSLINSTTSLTVIKEHDKCTNTKTRNI